MCDLLHEAFTIAFSFWLFKICCFFLRHLILLREKWKCSTEPNYNDGFKGTQVSIFDLSYPFLPLLQLFLCCALRFNIVLLPNFPLLLIVNSWQGLLGELILLQQQIQEHEEEARRATGQYNTSYVQQKRKVMDGLRGLLIYSH